MRALLESPIGVQQSTNALLQLGEPRLMQREKRVAPHCEERARRLLHVPRDAQRGLDGGFVRAAQQAGADRRPPSRARLASRGSAPRSLLRGRLERLVE